MKKITKKKEYHEYRVILDTEQNEQFVEFMKQFDSNVTGTFRRALRTLFETEYLKDQVFQNYLHGQKIMTLEK
jgi:hypothetical protein